MFSYNVQTTVTLPRVSDFPDLTRCERGKVQAAITNILTPHEQQHVRAFQTYNGSTRQAFDQTLCKNDVNSAVEALLSADQAPRQAQAQAASDALDPFNFDFDLDCDAQSSSNDADSGLNSALASNDNANASAVGPPGAATGSDDANA